MCLSSSTKRSLLLRSLLYLIPAAFACQKADAQINYVADPLKVCFSDIYQTQIADNSDINATSALILASASSDGGAHSRSLNISGSYGPYSGSVGGTTTDSYYHSLSTLNQSASSDHALHSYVMKTLSDNALTSMNHCMDTVAAKQPGQITVWPQVTSDPRRVIVNVRFVTPEDSPFDQNQKDITIELAKNDGQLIEGSTKMHFQGTSSRTFTLRREDASKPMLATVHVVNGGDKTIDIEGYHDFKFNQPSPSPCMVTASIVRISGPRFQDGLSRDKANNFEPVTFPTKGGLFNGLGWLVEPFTETFPDNDAFIISNIVLHDHKMTSPDSHVPLPENATIEYEFSAPVRVTQIEVVQHQWGINQLHAWLTDVKGDYASGQDLGIAVKSWPFPTLNPNGKSVLPEGQHDVFAFEAPNVVTGRYLRVVIERVVQTGGWASYRMFPRDRFGNRILPTATCEASTSTIY
jgi:hypothetical protein